MKALDLVIHGGIVYDGTGKPGVRADVGIKGNTIAAVGLLPPAAGKQRIDATGMAVAPGFIDLHSHSDLHALRHVPEKVLQGVTTELVGNCGFSTFPVAQERQQDFCDIISPILSNFQSHSGWASASQYLAVARSKGLVTNLATMVAHGTVRLAAIGPDAAVPKPEQLGTMAAQVEQALEEGAAGLSSGLMYAPGSFADVNELAALAQPLRRKGFYATHMRSYSFGLLDAIKETLAVGKAAGIPVHLSHLQAVGRPNWDKVDQALALIEQARAQGQDVTCDAYPYKAGSTVATQLLPQEMLAGGRAALLTRLRSAADRAQARRTMEAQRTVVQGWENIFIASVRDPGKRHMAGQNLAELAAASGQDVYDFLFDLLLAEEGQVGIVAFNQSDQGLAKVLAFPHTMIITDGFYVDGRPHPRLYGTYPHLLAEFVRQQRLLTWEQAIYKITALPASRLGLTDRGTIRPGARADLVVFHPDTIASPATYLEPAQRPAGIEHVIINGRVAVSRGNYLGTLAGEVLT
ncbi:MAG: D-aminoacylase [Deinococcus sp.]|nr:D-aminoacylase [Deinococcus sp.]